MGAGCNNQSGHRRGSSKASKLSTPTGNDWRASAAPRLTWIFNWTHGGYNSVTASSRRSALRLARDLGRGWGGVPVERTLHVAAPGELARIDAEYASLCD